MTMGSVRGPTAGCMEVKLNGGRNNRPFPVRFGDGIKTLKSGMLVGVSHTPPRQFL